MTLLVGAGCSVDPPSRLSDGRTMMKAIIDHACAESERKKIIDNRYMLAPYCAVNNNEVSRKNFAV
ncbi:MAG: hypothetical protein JW891_08385 [Candidatus Lokiarchaeota archaeon]|nr:hypothetical protein [Candidatus Lokiarchaeota archaeon]